MGSQFPAGEHDYVGNAYAYARWLLTRRGVQNPTSAQIRLVAARSVELIFDRRPADVSDDLFEAASA